MPRIAIAGVTGYVGGRLAPRLLEAGYRIRVHSMMSRDAAFAQQDLALALTFATAAREAGVGSAHT